MSRGGGSTEGLVNTALDILSPSVAVCPSSLFPPSLYLDKNCEVVRFHSASQAHSDDLPAEYVVQDDHMLLHTHARMSVSEHVCKHFY